MLPLVAFVAICLWYPFMIGIGGYCLLWRAIHRGMWEERGLRFHEMPFFHDTITVHRFGLETLGRVFLV